MPRDLPIGNGRLLVNFDRDYRVRDFYYPRVGQENHLQGRENRFGVWSEGKFAWMGREWERTLRYQKDTLVTEVTARHGGLDLTLQAADAVDFHLDLFLRRITVHNPSDRDREVRLFFHIDFHIFGNDMGDSCYYDPESGGIVHYKGIRWFLASGSVGERQGLDGFACGKAEVEGVEGTYRDAEDGELSGSSVAQGSVDSVARLTLLVPARASTTGFYWIAAGKDYSQVLKIHRVVAGEKGPEELMRRTADYWSLWVRKDHRELADLSPRIGELYRRSLLIMRTQIDDGGAVVAANDSDISAFSHDTYSYMWPRDGALVARSLIRAGHVDSPRRFFHFCRKVIRPEGYLMHKHNPDGSLASSWHPWFQDGKKRLPIQEDETALVLWSLFSYFQRFSDVEFTKPFFRPLIVAGADFLLKYRDEETGLPLPSHDLWEERYGVHTWTVAATIGGLRAAAGFAEAFGEKEAALRYGRVAEEMAAALKKYFFHADLARFARMGTRQEEGYLLDMTIDASLAGLFKFGAFPADDPQVVSTMDQVRERLEVRTQIGGWARYENDPYQQVEREATEAIPGNPWFVCSLWMAQYLIARATDRESLSSAGRILEWVADRALPSGVLAEQLHPYSGEPLSVSPLTWSHAAFVGTVATYLEKVGELERCEKCGAPSLR